MRQFARSSVVLLAVLTYLPLSHAQEPGDEILGAWQATSIVKAGKEAPPDAVKLMRMTFEEGRVLVRGNFQDGREASCKYKIDVTKTPKHFELLAPGEKNPALGIYRIENGKLEICMRKAQQPESRPESFNANQGDSNVLMKFERLESK